MDLMCCILSAAIRGANVSMCSLDSSDGKTALSLAAAGGRPDVVRWLLQTGPEVAVVMQQPDKVGARALHYAALEGHHHVCEVLLANGSNPDIADGTGLCPLHLAAEAGHFDTCKALVDGGADVNVTDSESTTPLLLAVESGHAEVCSLLTSARANPLASNIHGRTPMAVARDSGREELVSALEVAIWGTRKARLLQSRPGGTRSGTVLKGPEALDIIRRTIRAH
jgi:ankyrin repeat protein